MAKAATKDEPAGMDRAGLKRHLKFAQSEPIPIAFAIGGDGKVIVEMDKRKQGRALEKKLKDDSPDSKSHRFGTAVIDPDEPKVVRLTINKPSGGVARKLIVAFKGTGFNKVKILLEDGTEVESHEEEDTTQADDDDEEVGAKAPAEAKEPADAGRSEGRAAAAASTGEEAVAQQAAPPPAAPSAEAAALAKDLTGLVKRMLVVVAKEPAQKAELTQLATDAQASIKRGDLEQASAGLDIFRDAIEDVEAEIAGNKGGRPGGPATTPPGAGAKAAPHTGQPTPTPASHQQPPPPQAGQPNAAPPQGAHTQGAHPQGAQPQSPGKSNGAAPDLAAEAKHLLADLTKTVKQVLPMAASVPGLGDVIKSLTAAVQGHLRTGDHDAARAGIAQIAQSAAAGGMMGGMAGQPAAEIGSTLGAASPHHSPNAQAAHAQHAAKHGPGLELAQKVWTSTRTKIDTELEKLQHSFGSVLEGHGMLDTITKTIRTKVEGTLHHLDDGLNHTLRSVHEAVDAAEREKHVQAAHTLVQRYLQHVSTDPVIKMLDANPFRPIGIKAMVTSSLNAVSKHIR